MTRWNRVKLIGKKKCESWASVGKRRRATMYCLGQCHHDLVDHAPGRNHFLPWNWLNRRSINWLYHPWTCSSVDIGRRPKTIHRTATAASVVKTNTKSIWPSPLTATSKNLSVLLKKNRLDPFSWFFFRARYWFWRCTGAATTRPFFFTEFV